MFKSRTAVRARVQEHELLELEHWEAARAAPGLHAESASAERLEWHPARVPGTAASALAALGLWSPADEHDFDREEWWFRTSFVAGAADAGEEVVLCLDGLATVAEVHLNGKLVLESESMFQRHELDVGAVLRGANELVIRFRALSDLLGEARRPRARWRTRVVADGNLRFFRTTMLGRAPGFAPHPAPVGPWRGVRLERRRQLAIDDLGLVPRLRGGDGELEVSVRMRSLSSELESVAVVLDGSSGSVELPMALEPDRSGALVARGRTTLPGVAPWWPHTHGAPERFDVTLRARSGAGESEIDGGRIGFRELRAGPTDTHEPEVDGLDLHLNGERVFCRGVVWTPIDPVGLSPEPAELRASIEQARDAGINMLRLAGTGVYESEEFYECCDELGMLVWQDFMFANLDYPFASEPFRQLAEEEAEQVVRDLRGRPSIAVLCGNSEIEQQVGMLGLEPALGRDEFFARALPDKAREAGLDAVYLPSAPCGGELPFRPERGVANYFGVGAYMRGVEDARRSGVRFASECLAFSNVPDEPGVEAVLPGQPASIAMHHPRWKLGVPRDVGAGWDFEDVRDHYLEQLFGVRARELRSVDQERYLELSRAVTGELIAEVLGEWRRAASPCGGGIVLWWRDLLPGAGWGLLDSGGRPKLAYFHLRRVSSPVAVWTTDEGLSGVRVHVANDGPAALEVQLRVALYRDWELSIAEASESLELAPRACLERSVEGLLGRFVDAAWAYRFGPPAHDVIIVSLESNAEPPAVISQAVRFPSGRPLVRETPSALGLDAELRTLPEGAVALAIRSRRFAYGVRIHCSALVAEDQGFCVEPGHERLVSLGAADRGLEAAGDVRLTALNLEGAVKASEGSR